MARKVRVGEGVYKGHGIAGTW